MTHAQVLAVCLAVLFPKGRKWLYTELPKTREARRLGWRHRKRYRSVGKGWRIVVWAQDYPKLKSDVGNAISVTIIGPNQFYPLELYRFSDGRWEVTKIHDVWLKLHAATHPACRLVKKLGDALGIWESLRLSDFDDDWELECPYNHLVANLFDSKATEKAT